MPNIRKLILKAFYLSLATARLIGLTRPLRILVGPLLRKIILGLTNSKHRPLDVQGHQMVLAAPGRYPPIAMVIGEYEKQTTLLLERILNPGMVVVDVGAHVGYFSLIAARQVGLNGKVYAFEPDPSNFELLIRNIELNKYTNITGINAGIADQIGSRTLFQTSLDSGRQSTYDHGLPASGRLEIQTRTLDEFFITEGLIHVDLIKVDVEGAELDVLRGMQQVLHQAGNLNLIMEFNPRLLKGASVNPSALLKHLTSLKFSVSYINEQVGLVPMGEPDIDDLITKLIHSDSSVNLYCFKA